MKSLLIFLDTIIKMLVFGLLTLLICPFIVLFLVLYPLCFIIVYPLVEMYNSIKGKTYKQILKDILIDLNKPPMDP